MFKVKNHFSEWYQSHDAFVVRNPLFPVETFFKWTTDPGGLPSSSKERLRSQLREFYLQPVAQEALYIGSPDLHGQLQLWLQGKIDKPDKRDKTELSLVKYMIRMCTRCTPYGLFASCSVGRFADRSHIALEHMSSVERRGRLDMDYVGEVCTYLLKQKEITDQLLFYPNTSLYPLGDQLRYMEHRFNEKSGRSYHLVQVERSEYLEQVLQAASNGLTPSRMAALLTGDEISEEEAMEFIQELITSQVLVSELEPTVTGEEYFRILVRRLAQLRGTEKVVAVFEKVLEEFRNIRETTIDDRSEFYSRLVQHLKTLDIPLNLKTLVQVDSYRPVLQAALHKRVSEELMAGASLLQLFALQHPVNSAFNDFKSAFHNRYESQWIPLVEVLDTESGIGYGKFAAVGMDDSPLIDKLAIGDGKTDNAPGTGDQPEDFVWKIYQESLAQNTLEVELTGQLLEQLSKKEFQQEGLPDSMHMMFRLMAGNEEEIDSGRYSVLLQPPTGPSGSNLLGRFCHLHPEIEQLSREILAGEEAHRKDCIYVEIVHLPESRIGNILMRPVLRNYEIPYLCGSSLDPEHQVPVSDLLVGIENDRVVLRSGKHGKEVIPRLTTAHNFNQTTLPVYQFLCDLQYQGVRHVGFRWGLLENRPFLPRVKVGRFILSKARWILEKEDIKDLDKSNESELIEKFSQVSARKKLPQYVLLSQGDNELLLDLKNIFCLRLLLQELGKNDAVMLTESFELPGQCWITSMDGHHAGEFIAAFTRKIPEKSEKEIAKTAVPSDGNGTMQTERYYPVGSEWLYAKIYCGTRTAEKILGEVLKPFTEELISQGVIDKYFFLRYKDESNHLRIRFHHAGRQDFWKEVIARLTAALKPFMDNHTVSNLQFETYQRELERYGHDTMELSEDIFHHQSVAVLNFLSLLDGDDGEHIRWQVGLKAMDIFLDDFQYSLEQKRDLIKKLHKGFSDEFKVGAIGQKKISERFSSNKKQVQQVLSNAWEEDENLSRGIGIFLDDDAAYRALVRSILEAGGLRQDQASLNRIMSSYLHMFVNRMFVSNHRKIELVLYDYLLKYYESRLAIEKAQKIKSELQV